MFHFERILLIRLSLIKSKQVTNVYRLITKVTQPVVTKCLRLLGGLDGVSIVTHVSYSPRGTSSYSGFNHPNETDERNHKASIIVAL